MIMSMQKWQSARTRTPYDSPQAEVLVIRFEEQFLHGTNGYGYNDHYNEKPGEGDIVEIGD